MPGANREALGAIIDTVLMAIRQELQAYDKTVDQKILRIRIGADALKPGAVDSAALAQGAVSAGNVSGLDVVVKEEVSRADITVGQITNLNATVAQIADVQIKNADIDFAQINGVAAGTVITAEMVGDKVYIKNLKVDDATIVSLTAGELMIKGKDGRMYALTVGAGGAIVAEPKYIINDDVGNLSINAGEKLVAGSVTATCLAAGSVTTDKLLAGSVTAGKLAANSVTAGKIEAGAITVSHLAANVGSELNLSSNKSITGIVSQEVKDAVGFRVEVIATSNVLSSEIPSTVLTARVWEGKQEVTDTLPAGRFAWVRITSDTVADELWNAGHKGVKQVALTTRDVASSATYRCNITDGK